MRLKSIIKYNINNVKSAILIYYSIFITIGLALILLAKNSDGSITSSGVEMTSVIFIFITGLNFFKENFYFMKSSNVTRKEFLYGTAISMIPIVLIMSIIDIIINRIYNIFVVSPTNYDMIYTSLRSENWFSNNNWVQSNSIETLFNTFIFQAAVYLAFFSLGFLVTIIYYKCNKLMKVVVSILPIALIMILNIIGEAYPSLINKANNIITTILGWDSQNSYMAVLTFSLVYIILIIISRLLTKKAIIKQV